MVANPSSGVKKGRIGEWESEELPLKRLQTLQAAFKESGRRGELERGRRGDKEMFVRILDYVFWKPILGQVTRPDFCLQILC